MRENIHIYNKNYKRLVSVVLATIMVATLLPINSFAAESITVAVDNDSTYIPTAIINGSFETDDFKGGSDRHDVDKGWTTTDSSFERSNKPSTYGISSVADGSWFIEMNYVYAATIYQDLTTHGGDVIRWTLAHAARTNQGDDPQTMEVQIGASDGNNPSGINSDINTHISANSKVTFSAGGITNPAGNTYGYGLSSEYANLSVPKSSSEWKTAKGIYVIPEGQTVTRFAFVSTCTGSPSAGNLLDNITFSTLIGNLKAVVQNDGSVKVTGYWGDSDSSKKLIIKIGNSSNTIDMSSVRHKNFVITIPLSIIGEASSLDVYHQDYESAKRTITIEHSHNWTYSADGATLIAKCIGYKACTVAGAKDTGVSLVLTKGSQTYTSGLSAIATMNTEAWINAGLSVPTIKYYQDNNEITPKDIGLYTAKICPVGVTANDDNTAVLTCEIGKASLNVTGADIADKTYNGDTVATVNSVTFSGLQNSETLIKDTDYTVVGVFYDANAGANTVTVTVSLISNAKTNNYILSSSTRDVSKTITRAVQNKTVNAPESIVSKSNNSVTVSPVTVADETVEYAVNTMNSAPSSGWQESTQFTGLTANTTYYIFSRVKESNNYEAGVASTGSLEVKTKQNGPGTPTVTVDYENEKTNQSIADTIEYTLDNGNTWITGSNTEVSLQDGKTYKFRVKETDTVAAGSEAVITIPARPVTSVAVDYTAETVNTTTSMEYKLPGEAWADCTANMNAVCWAGKTVEIRIKQSGSYYVGTTQTITVGSRAETPNLTATLESVANKKDAKLNGVTTAMQYKIGDGAWQNGTGGDIANAGNATITVRVKSTDSSFASEEQAVVFTPSTTQLAVTYNTQGGSAIDSVNVDYNSKLTAPASTPTKTGYTFGGWYKEASCQNVWNFISDSVTDTTTLYAKWTGYVYTVAFDANGGEGTMSNQNFVYGDNQALAKNEFTKSGYVFSGWATSADGSREYTDEQVVQNLIDVNGATVTLYAVWTAPISSPNSTTVDKTTVTNPDGSTTQTETKSDGSIVTTTKGKDGSVTKTESKTETADDGSKVEKIAKSEIRADGTKSQTTAEIKTDKDGNVTSTSIETAVTKDGTSATKVENKNGSGNVETKVEATVTSTAVVTSQQENKPVSIPVTVEATKTTETATTVSVSVPKTSESVKIEVPVTNVSAGTVAVIVKEDGSEEVVKASVVTENGVAMNVSGNVTVKIVDNSKNYEDVGKSYWANDSIDFASSREIFSGVSKTAFAPEGVVTRAMTYTVLARFADARVNTTGSEWFADSMSWAVEQGISDGTNPNREITREQLATMLYRFAKDNTATADLSDFSDSSDISDYAVEALQWAVSEGIINGIDGKLAPQELATRAQLAAIMQRYCINVAF